LDRVREGVYIWGAAPEIAGSRDLARDPTEIAQSGAINPNPPHPCPLRSGASADPRPCSAQPWPDTFNPLQSLANLRPSRRAPADPSRLGSGPSIVLQGWRRSSRLSKGQGWPVLGQIVADPCGSWRRSGEVHRGLTKACAISRRGRWRSRDRRVSVACVMTFLRGTQRLRDLCRVMM
jgi:hypothetical protein